MAAEERDMNRDPITDEPGAHPIGTGIGATGGAVAGAAAGAIGGPIGVAVGGVLGAVVGGLAGKAAGEAVNPTAEEAYWRDNYSKASYYEAGRSFDDYGPAYRLGLTGRTRYEDDWDIAEPRLAAEWDSARAGSSLSWPQAQPASRAAWDRVDSYRRDRKGINNGDIVDTLDDLAETCKDGEYGFRACAEQAERQDLKALFLQRADDCRGAAQELYTQIRSLGGKPDDGGTAAGAMHRGWVSVKASLSTYDDKAVLEECERGEDHALAQYRKALKQDLPADVRILVERQLQGAQRNHDQVKALRDQFRAAS
ncbi:PA2169 family four-helix-bundle protein [uncultured Ramlibacter sp.]|uniref:ferritin-like domain-containing protein n=1 Tax=uncultured Ramlibacter sp. TaxID=260755 RepID=UPI002627AF01|nr:PA2169 family four-helix-bundle protein [uncultured Ramlibacter sp.]